MVNKEIYNELYKYIQNITGIINTHSHLLTDNSIGDISLKELLQMTYISWGYPNFEDTNENRKKYTDTMYTNSYFYWMAKSLGELYCDNEPVSVDNWDKLEKNYKMANKNVNHGMEILKDICGYGSIILDDNQNPGSDRDFKKIVTPAYRCDPYFFGYSFQGRDSSGNNPYNMMGLKEKSLTLCDYISQMENNIKHMKQKGCVAIKIAIAYERGIDFLNDDKSKAEKVFLEDNPTQSQIKDFQDYVMFCICRLAGKLDMPVQIHTGLGKLEKSNALSLKRIIHENPDTKFSLFHCGYPWMDDVMALLHNYRNVYPDLCWLPLISTGAAIRFIREALEVGDSQRMCWGCDTWTPQESLGALLALRHCLATALSQMCEENILTVEKAKQACSNILKENPEKLYFNESSSTT